MSKAKRNVLRHILALLADAPDRADKVPPTPLTELVSLGYWDPDNHEVTDKGRDFIAD